MSNIRHFTPSGFVKTLQVFILVFILLTSFPNVKGSTGHNLSVSSFVVYYGSNRVEELCRFDLAILSPLLEKHVVDQLSGFNVICVGYLSITTVGGWEPWAANVTDEIVVGESSVWGEKIVNACDPAWWSIVLNYSIPYILEKGFSGVFLDNLDMVDVYPWMKECLILLIKEIRSRYPGIIIVVNRGFTIIDDIAPYIDAVLFECFGTYYDFKTGKYLKWTGGDYQWITSVAEHLVELREKCNITVLALGYADLGNETMLQEYSNYVNSLAEEYGFIPYVAEVSLMKVNPLYPQTLSMHGSPTPGTTTTTPTAKTTINQTFKSTEIPQGLPSKTSILLVIAVIIVVGLAVVVALILLTKK